MMIRRFALALVCALFALPALAAPARSAHRPVPVPAPIAMADTVRVALVTTQGTIVVDLDGKHAPITAANFLRYVDARRFDGTTFYRAMKVAWGDQPNGLIQGGQREVHHLFPPIAHEPTTLTGLTHRAGALSMARNAPGTADAMFTIMVGNIPELDADPKATDPNLQAGYAVFGQVVSGMDVVRKIFDSPVSPTAGEGAMRGQMLAEPVRLLTARRVPVS